MRIIFQVVALLVMALLIGSGKQASSAVPVDLSEEADVYAWIEELGGRFGTMAGS